MVIFVDRSADGAKTVVAVCEHIGQRELPHAGSFGGLYNAYKGDIVSIKVTDSVKKGSIVLKTKDNTKNVLKLGAEIIDLTASNEQDLIKLINDYVAELGIKIETMQI